MAGEMERNKTSVVNHHKMISICSAPSSHVVQIPPFSEYNAFSPAETKVYKVIGDR